MHPTRGFKFSPLVECLKSLPHLHMLSIGLTYGINTAPLANALEGVQLPQIKTLILPPHAYPFLQHSPNVEDIVCTTVYASPQSRDGFLGSLVSNRDSKLKRLAISLALLPNPLRKWSSTSWDHGMIMMTVRLRP